MPREDGIEIRSFQSFNKKMYSAKKQLSSPVRDVQDQILLNTGRNSPLQESPRVTPSKLGEMSLDIDASSLLIYRAAWTKDKGRKRITKEAAMAKLFATEAAQRVIDEAVQIFGGSGVVSGFAVEQLYREIRSLRIYEGASEVQKLIIASQTLNEN